MAGETFEFRRVKYDLLWLWNAAEKKKHEKWEMKLLEHHFSAKVWDNKTLTPKEVLDNPQGYPEHAGRIENADLDYPLLVVYGKENVPWIIDGVHRLCKAHKTGKKTVKIIIIDPETLEKAKISQ